MHLYMKGQKKRKCYLCITLASQSPSLPLSLSLSAPLSAPCLSLPYPATTDGVDCFLFDHERGTMPVCTSVNRTRERVKHEIMRRMRRKETESGRKWTYQKKQGMLFIRFRRAHPDLKHAVWHGGNGRGFHTVRRVGQSWIWCVDVRWGEALSMANWTIFSDSESNGIERWGRLIEQQQLRLSD